MKTMSGIDAAPSVVTITGAMPVTRIVPARPMTNAPHQFVSFASPPPAYSSSSRDAAPAPGSSAMDFFLLWMPRAKCGTTQGGPDSQASTALANPVQGTVWALDTRTARNVGGAPIARARRESIYVPVGSPWLSRARRGRDVPRKKRRPAMAALDHVSLNGDAPFTPPETADEAREYIRANGIEFLFAQFVDMHGKPNAKLVPASHFDDLISDGAGFAGFAAGEIGQRPNDPDLA